MKVNEPLADRLKAAEVFEEFTALIFDQELPYEELLEQLEKWGISSSLGALSRFKASHRGPWAMERAKREHEAFLRDHGADLDDAERRLVAMRIFQDAASPQTSTKDVLRMRDQHLGAAKLKIENERLKNDGVKLQQAERKLAQKDEEIELQKRKIEALEAQATAAAVKLQELRDPAKAEDPAVRAKILDEVDRAMGLKK
jgi:hypothetical protein